VSRVGNPDRTRRGRTRRKPRSTGPRERGAREVGRTRPEPSAATEASRTHAELDRLLTMIPYLYENGRVPVEEVAARFALTPEEVVEAIDRIATLGDELLDPHQLVDAYIEEGVDIRCPAVRRPIRLTARRPVVLAGAYACGGGLPSIPRSARDEGAGATPRASASTGILSGIAFEHEARRDAQRWPGRDKGDRGDQYTDRVRITAPDRPTSSGITAAWYCAAWCPARGNADRWLSRSGVRERAVPGPLPISTPEVRRGRSHSAQGCPGGARAVRLCAARGGGRGGVVARK
jgi:hypothetical protein